MSQPSRITLSLTYRLAVIAAIFVPHNVAELRGAAILLLLWHAVTDLIETIRYLYSRVGDWVVDSIDWTGPLTQPWRQPSLVETFARIGKGIGEIAVAFTALGTAFRQTYWDGVVAIAQAEEAAEHASRSEDQ